MRVFEQGASLDPTRSAEAIRGSTRHAILRMPEKLLERLPAEEFLWLAKQELPGDSRARIDAYRGERLPRVLAHGDSWFAYPRSWLLLGPASNIVLQLHSMGGLDITSLASNGAEMVSMMSGEDREGFVDSLRSGAFDAVIVSGGGNDIVGKYNIDYLVERKKPGKSAVEHVRQDRFGRRLGQIQSAYGDLLDLVGEFGKDEARVLVHTYDVPFASGRGAKFLGGLVEIRAWISPYLSPLGFERREQEEIVRWMLQRFSEMLKALQLKAPSMLEVIETHGTLPEETDWRDEIHPTPDGFLRLASLFHKRLVALSAG